MREADPPAERPATHVPIESRAKALIAARAALDKFAEDVIVIDVRSLSTVTDFFVIGTAMSTRQLAALQEHIETQLAQQGERLWHVEGMASHSRTSLARTPEAPQWVLMDCGDIVVHLMDTRARELYQLERLWADAPRIPLTPNA